MQLLLNRLSLDVLHMLKNLATRRHCGHVDMPVSLMVMSVHGPYQQYSYTTAAMDQ